MHNVLHSCGVLTLAAVIIKINNVSLDLSLCKRKSKGTSEKKPTLFEQDVFIDVQYQCLSLAYFKLWDKIQI